jgi:hypothetical protein
MGLGVTTLSPMPLTKLWVRGFPQRSGREAVPIHQLVQGAAFDEATVETMVTVFEQILRDMHLTARTLRHHRREKPRQACQRWRTRSRSAARSRQRIPAGLDERPRAVLAHVSTRTVGAPTKSPRCIGIVF